MIGLMIGFIGCVGLCVYLYRRISVHEIAILELLKLHENLLESVEIIDEENKN